mgnify:CR=1 FL=1
MHVVAAIRDHDRLRVGVEILNNGIVFRLDVLGCRSSNEERWARELAKRWVVNPCGECRVQKIQIKTPLVVFRSIGISNQILQ